MIQYIVDFERVKHLLRGGFLPHYIIEKLQIWATRVEMIGLEETRKIQGFHDEPLMGRRFGQRSIRLNKAYRAFYIVKDKQQVIIVEVLEVNKHEY